MNKKVVSLLCVAFSLIAASCIKDPIPVPSNPTTPATGNLVAVNDSAAYSCREFADAVGNCAMFSSLGEEMGAVSNLITPAIRTLVAARQPILDAHFANTLGRSGRQNRQWQLETYSFSYNTISAQGEPIVLSGRVTFPNNTVDSITHVVEGISIYNHPTLFGMHSAPSESFTFGSMRALYNEAVIETDLQGYGIDHDVHIIAPICFQAHGRQIMDCAMAALEVMQRHNVVLDSAGHTTNWGTSHGTASTLAFVKHYDLYATEQQRNALRLEASYVGEGPVDIAAELVYAAQNPEEKILTVDFMAGISTLSKQQLHGYSSSDLLAPTIYETKVSNFDDTVRLIDALLFGYVDPRAFVAINSLGFDTMPFMASDMYDANGNIDLDNAKTQVLVQILREQGNWDNWTPQTEIYLSHDIDDDFVPYPVFYNLCRSLHSLAPDKVHMFTPRTRLVANNPIADNIGTHMVLAAEAMVISVMAREPHDVARFLKSVE